MAFNINAQVVLSGPKNIKTVRSNIQKQLSGITSSVKIDLDKAANANLSNLNKQLKTTNTILKQVAATEISACTLSFPLSKKEVIPKFLLMCPKGCSTEQALFL